MRQTALVGFFLVAGTACSTAHAQQAASPLKAPRDFAASSDSAERARALFVELDKVLQSPRCRNCHLRES